MWRKLFYSGFETCFGPSTHGAGTKTHLKSRFCAILKKGGAIVILDEHSLPNPTLALTCAYSKGCDGAGVCCIC